MRARFAIVPIVALSAAIAGGASTRASSPSARLLDIRPHVDGKRFTVLIESSAPVSYAASQPDPLTVLVDLRSVSAEGARNQITAAVGPLADVSVEEAAAFDGTSVARVRLGLAAPVPPKVRSERNTIRVEFDQPAVAPGVHVLGTTPPPAVDGRATTLSAIKTEVINDRLHVILTGNGRIEPGTVETAKDQPPRLFVDLPGVRSTTAAVVPVGRMDVERVRVAANSTSPVVTRVVIDLARATAYRTVRAGEDGRDFAVVIGDEAPAAPAAAADPAPPPAPAPAAAAPVAEAAAPMAEAAAPQQATAQAPAPAAAQAKPAPKTVKAPAPSAPVAPKLEIVSPEAKAAADAAKAGASGAADRGTSTGMAPMLSSKPGQPRPAPGSAAAQGDRAWSGHPVSLDFDGVDLSAVLRTFAEITNMNIVVDRRVEGKVNVSLRDVPWDQALDIILRANQLGYTVEGNIIRIAPLDVLAQEEKQRRELVEQQTLSGELEVTTRTLSYARASQLAKLVTKSALSSRGSVDIDERTNTLIITDLPERIATANSLLSTLDRPEPQVEIEARIVQTAREFARSIGVQWGINGYVSPEFGNTTGLSFPNQGSLTGRTGAFQGDGQRTTNSGVSLAAPNPTSAIGLALGSINGAFNLDVALTALEKQGKGRVLSTPRVSTQNNIEAEVTQGVQIPIQTVANNTVTVTFKDAALTLKVKPQITAANTVIMRVTLENASPDYSRQVNGIPPIDTQRAVTEVLVNDGFTTVIGGIFVSREATVNDRTPGLHRIPLLGWLFKRDSIADESRELLIFITPRIIKS